MEQTYPTLDFPYCLDKSRGEVKLSQQDMEMPYRLSSMIVERDHKKLSNGKSKERPALAHI